MHPSPQQLRFPCLGPLPGGMDASTVKRLIEVHHGTAPASGEALQILVTVMHHAGYVDTALLQHISDLCHFPLADLRALCSFYSFLDQASPCRYRILVSTNVIDEQYGAQEALTWLQDHFRGRSDIVIKATACTGFADLAPGALINGIPVTRFNHDRARETAALIEADIPLAQWPSSFFDYHSTLHRRDSLLEMTVVPGQALGAAKRFTPSVFIAALQTSGLRGRGGAGFPTWQKWATAASMVDSEKYVVCNADEGEPGTFKDRILLGQHIDAVIEGMCLCGWAIGARQGFIYLRGEYLWLYAHIKQHLEQYRQAGILDASRFDIAIHVGAGAYVCGEESALLESLEGKRGIPRIRPPFPVQQGYRGKPTVVNNVETFCAVTWIALNSAEAFAQSGTPSSRGTKLHSVSGDCDKPGIYELPMGVSVSTLLNLCGARDPMAVQVGGPSGRLLFAPQFDTAIDFAHVSSGGSFMVFSTQREELDILRNFARFFAHESCGFCTPCRAGTPVIARTLDEIAAGKAPPNAARDLQELIQLLHVTSHCGLGQTATCALNDFIAQRPARFAALTQPRNLAAGMDVFLRESSP